MQGAESRLGDIDAFAGDGDHGFCMSRGSDAASKAAAAALAHGAGAGSVLQLAGDAWGDRAGGASGALWGVALRAWGDAFSDAGPVTAEDVVRGARTALGAVTSLGGAQIGDKTLVDALEPFVETLAARGRGRPKPRRGVALGGGSRFRRRDRDRSARPEARPGAAPGGEERRPSRPGRDLLGIVREGGRRGPAPVLALRRREAPSNPRPELVEGRSLAC